MPIPERPDWEGYDAADTPTARARYAEQDVLALVEACKRLLVFNQELCEDIGVSTNYPSALKARAALAKFEEVGK